MHAMKRTPLLLTVVFLISLLTACDGITGRAVQELSANESALNIIIDIPENYHAIQPGEQLISNIKLLNLGSQGRVDAILDFTITDEENNTLVKKKETVAVETQANFVRYFNLPPEAKPGLYTLNVHITYDDGLQAASEHSFTITKKRSLTTIYYGVLALLIATVIIILFLRSRTSRKETRIRKKVRYIVRKRLK